MFLTTPGWISRLGKRCSTCHSRSITCTAISSTRVSVHGSTIRITTWKMRRSFGWRTSCWASTWGVSPAMPDCGWGLLCRMCSYGASTPATTPNCPTDSTARSIRGHVPIHSVLTFNSNDHDEHDKNILLDQSSWLFKQLREPIGSVAYGGNYVGIRVYIGRKLQVRSGQT